MSDNRDPEAMDVDLRLEGLAHRTAGVKPRADFQARVMAAIHDEDAPVSTGFGLSTWRLGWRVLPVAMLVASAAVLLAVRSATFYDDALIGAYDDSVDLASATELGW